MSSTYQTIQHILYSGQRGRSPFSCKHSGSESHCRSIGWHPSSLPTPLHCTRHSHLLQVVPNLLNQCQGNLSKSFLKGSVIHYFYCVFHRVGIAQFCWIQCEHVMLFGQELVGSICYLGGPRVQPTQIQFIEQFTMSLPNSQSGGMGTLGLVTPSCNWTSSGGLRTGSATTALATRVFFWRFCE